MKYHLLSLVVVFTLLFSQFALSREEDPTRDNRLFAAALVGPGAMTETDNVPPGVNNDQEIKGGTALIGVVGYKFKYFSMEFTYANFGQIENTIGDTYREVHKASFIGAGPHWTWGWFDLKLGWGTVRDKFSYELASEGTSISATKNGSTIGSSASYFGLGLNFDMSKYSEFIIDYTAYAWSDSTKRTLNVNGGGDMIFDNGDYGIAVLSIGIRIFI